MDGVISLTYLTYLQENGLATVFDLSAVKENAIISVENALVTHKDIVPQQDLVIIEQTTALTVYKQTKHLEPIRKHLLSYMLSKHRQNVILQYSYLPSFPI